MDRTRTPVRTTFALLAVSVAAFTLLQSLIVPVLERIRVELGTDQATVTWVLTAYLLSAAISTPLVGRLGDAVGKKRMLVIALVALSAGSFAAALAPSVGWMVAARVVQGVGGGVMPLAFGIIRDEFPPERRSGALSVIAALAAVGFGVGIVIGGPIVAGLGYRWLFWLPMIVTAVAAVGVALVVPESPVRSPGRLPLGPALALSATLVCLLLGVSEGNAWGWTSPGVLGLLAAALVLGVVWVRSELRARVPLVDMRMMRRRGIWTANLVSGCTGFGMFAAFSFVPQFLQTPVAAGYGFGATLSESGRVLLPSAVASFLVGFWTARLIRLAGARAVIALGCLLNGVAFVSIGLFHDALWQLYAATVVQGVGGGLIFSSLANVVVASVPASQTGVANGMNFNIRTIGGALGTATMAAIVTAGHAPGELPSEGAYTAGFVVLGCAMLSAAAIALAVPDIRRSEHQALEDADNTSLGSLPVDTR